MRSCRCGLKRLKGNSSTNRVTIQLPYPFAAHWLHIWAAVAAAMTTHREGDCSGQRRDMVRIVTYDREPSQKHADTRQCL